MSSEQTATSVERVYQERRDRFAREAERFQRHEGKLILARGLTFLAAMGAFLLAGLDENLRGMWIATGTLLLLAFLACAILDDWYKRQRDYRRQLEQVNRWQLARIRRQWHELPVPQIEVPSESVALARDLDLFGQASLFQLVCHAHTPRGKTILRDWIVATAAPEEVADRQRAVQTLTPQLELREELMLRGHVLARSLAGPEAFAAWAEGQPLLQRHAWLKWTSWTLTLLSLTAFTLLFAGLAAPNVSASLIAVALILNVFVSVVFTGSIHDIFDSISTRNGEMRHYLALFELIAQLPDAAPRLAAIRHAALEEDLGALHQLRRLHWIMKLASLRHDPLLSILYFALQGVVLWDFHALWVLERWQQRCSRLVRPWFEALGQFEALASLSGLAYDQPDWCFPVVASNAPREFRATGLGHPLLKDTVRVTNDVVVGPDGTVLLVTGSNMSGKSTLLRSIGLNAMLAEAGGPVCAQSLSMPPLKVATSMRVQDSLEDGVSFFMAELKRLKRIVDEATHYERRDDRAFLYLLDEILQGTNSVERHLAVARVLAHLVERRAIGAVSTHDLELARSPELARCCETVHFRETLHGAGSGQQMTFDYKLRSGLATTTNAIKLLELVGLVPAAADRDCCGSGGAVTSAPRKEA